MRVVQPLREHSVRLPRGLLFGSDIASLYVQPHIGGVNALLAGAANATHASWGMDAAAPAAHAQRMSRQARHPTKWSRWRCESGPNSPNRVIHRSARRTRWQLIARLGLQLDW